MAKRQYIQRVVSTEADVNRSLPWVHDMTRKALANGPVMVRLMRPQRSKAQNDHLHPVMRRIAKHMEAHGAPKRTERWWRRYFVGKCFGTEMVPDPDGTPDSYVVVGKAEGTSDLSVPEAGEFLEWLYAYGTDLGVEWVQSSGTDAGNVIEMARNQQGQYEAMRGHGKA